MWSRLIDFIRCMDESIIGTPFYIMEFLKGRIFTDVRMPEIKSKSEREECWKDIVRVLAKLHKLRPEDVGLENYASRKPFYPRQIKSVEPPVVDMSID